MRNGRLVALALVAGCAVTSVLVTSPPAFAQPKTDKDTHAKELFAKGDTAYAEGRYEEALAAFQEAYELSNRPQLLFNVSNALERLGRLPEAVAALEKYLASGKAKDRDVVQKRLANLRKRVEEQKKEQERIAKEEEEKEKARKEKEEADRRKAELAPPEMREVPLFTSQPERPSKALPIALLVTGGAALIAGGVFGVMTLSARSEAADGCKEGSAGNLCSSDAKSALDREKTFALVTDISLASGIIISGVGLYLLLSASPGPELRARAASAAGPVRVTGRPGGAGVELVGSF